MSSIDISNVTKRYGSKPAVDNVSLTINEHEFMVLLGPSGCGKTTLLRSIVGLETIDSGSISIGGRDVTALAPRKRNISMVFQSYAVFPHMTVFENIAFGLRNQKVPDAEVKRRVGEAAELLHITELLERRPAAASGGQRQRIAVARAIAVSADVLLMDEPLSNLDALLRMEMRAELKRLMKELRVTVVYVTHDQIEALSMGDRIAVMKDGQILQCAPPLEVYDRPADKFVGSFIGNPPMNFVNATSPIGGPGLMGIRAENITVYTTPHDGLVGEVSVLEPLGSQNLFTVRLLSGETVKLSTRPDLYLEAGSQVWLEPIAAKTVWFDPASGKPLETASGAL
jgi:multiple sugar transport system ATP-binding protein